MSCTSLACSQLLAPVIYRKLPGSQFLISCTCTFWIWPWTSTLEFACPYLNMQVYMCNRPVACPARTLPLGLCQQGQAPATLQIWIVWVDENGWNHGLPYWPDSGSQTSKRKSNLKLCCFNTVDVIHWASQMSKWLPGRNPKIEGELEGEVHSETSIQGQSAKFKSCIILLI